MTSCVPISADDSSAVLYTGPRAENVGRIPAQLRARHQWVLWRASDRIDRQTGEIVGLDKRPINPESLLPASSTDSRTWGSFAQCVAALPVAIEEWEEEAPDSYRGGGLGYVLQRGDPFTGIDLDHCIDADTGAIACWAQCIVEALSSYTEVTPSSLGLHIWVTGGLPPTGRKRGPVELYDQARFLTVTGWHLPGTPRSIEARQEALYEVHGRVFGPQLLLAADGTSRCYCPTCDYVCTHTPTGLCPACSTAPIAPAIVTPHPASTPLLGDAELLEKAGAAGNGAGARFRALFEGDCSGYASHSEADLGLCVRLAFWSKDPDQIDALFRQSALMRPKWDKKHGAQTYGKMTVAKALAIQTEQYMPGTNARLVHHDPSRPYHKPLPGLRTTLRSLSTRLRGL